MGGSRAGKRDRDGGSYSSMGTYLSMNRGHVGLGHIANHDLVVGTVEQLVVVHDAVHGLGNLVLLICWCVA